MMLTAPVLALYLTLGSYHFDRSKPRNESNPGIAAEFSIPGAPESLTGVVGVYENSHWRATAHAQLVWTAYERGEFAAGASAGFGTGYASPIVGGLFVRYGPAHLTVIPPVPGASDTGVLALSLRWGFK